MKISTNFSLVILILSLLVALPLPSFAIDVITEEEIAKFLDLEKAYLNKKNTEGYISLFSDDYIHTDSDGKVFDKAETRLYTYNLFMTALHVRHKLTLKSAQISADGKSAIVTLINDTKSLFEMHRKRFVIRSYFEASAKLVLIDGKIKYKQSSFVKDL